MEILRFSIGAGETKVFVKAGRYFEVVASTNPVDVGFYDASGTQTEDARAVSAGFYAKLNYGQFEIRSDTAQSVELLVARAEAGSKQLPGVVQVVDGARERTRAGIAFGFYLNGGSAAGQYSKPTLKNKSTDTRLVLERLWVASDQAGQITLWHSDNNIPATLGNPPTSKLTGAFSAKAETRSGTTASLSTAPGLIGGVVVAANQSFVFDFREPIILDPGACFAVCSLVLGAITYLGGEFYEIPAA